MKILTNKFFILGNLLLLLIAIPVTMYFVAQQQEIRSKAAPSSRLYFQPATATTSTTCSNFILDLYVDPGSNLVSFVTPFITYDTTKVDVTQITPASGFTVHTPSSINNGEATVTIDVVSGGNTVQNGLTTVTKVATVTFIPKATGSVDIQLDSSRSEVLALEGGGDEVNANVLSTVGNATVTINSDACATGASITPGTTPGTTPGVSVTPNPLTASPTPTGTASAGATLTPTPTLIASATPTLIPPPTLIPTAIPTIPPPTPTLVEKPTIAPTGSVAQTVGIMAAVVLAIIGGFALLAL